MISLNATEIRALAQVLEADLLKLYGPLLGSDELRSALGYPSLAALRQAAFRGNLPVPSFVIEGRRGHFALAKDVALWLATKRMNGLNTSHKGFEFSGGSDG